MMGIIENSGTSLAYPSQRLFMAQDSSISTEKTALVSETVKKWKEKNELQLPQFDPKRVEELRNSIQYPDKGSFQFRKE